MYGGRGSGTFGQFDTDMQYDMQYPPFEPFEGHHPPGRGFAEGVRGPQQQQVLVYTLTSCMHLELHALYLSLLYGAIAAVSLCTVY
jgi:hypothetical protein